MTIRGSYVVVGLVGAAFLAGMIFWWLEGHTFYEETHQESVDIAGGIYPVTEWQGVESANAPLAMRACFVLQARVQALEELSPRPQPGPGWLKCFDAETIAENLANGYAKAYVAARNDPPGFDRIVAIFPGGRSYMWRQPGAQITE